MEIFAFKVGMGPKGPMQYLLGLSLFACVYLFCRNKGDAFWKVLLIYCRNLLVSIIILMILANPVFLYKLNTHKFFNGNSN